jgi:hypothetical protein
MEQLQTHSATEEKRQEKNGYEYQLLFHLPMYVQPHAGPES